MPTRKSQVSRFTITFSNQENLKIMEKKRGMATNEALENLSTRDRNEYLLNTGLLSDCSFILLDVANNCREEKILAHKLILAAASPVFMVMFYGGLAPAVEDGQTKAILVEDIQPDVFQAMLRYIYTDQTELGSFEQAIDLCYAAKKYILSPLSQKCIEHIFSLLSPENACKALEFAELIDADELMTKSMQIIQTQTNKVLASKTFDEIQLKTLIWILDQDNLTVKSEVDLFKALSQYYNANHSENEAGESGNGALSIRDALRKIRFLSLSPNEFASMPTAKVPLLTHDENNTILGKLLPRCIDISMPDNFSTSTKKRRHCTDCSCRPLASNKYLCRRHPHNSLSDCSANGWSTKNTFNGNASLKVDRDIVIHGIEVPLFINKRTATFYFEDSSGRILHRKRTAFSNSSLCGVNAVFDSGILLKKKQANLVAELAEKAAMFRHRYLLSDVESADCLFLVGNEEIKAHTGMLAHSSPVFKAMFCGPMAPADNTVTIDDLQPEIFRDLLNFIYKGYIGFATFEQACQLCYAARKYMLPELAEKSFKHMGNHLRAENVLKAYEFAELYDDGGKKKTKDSLAAKCLQVMKRQTRKVLTLDSFIEAKLTTILCLFNLDFLAIESELDLFEALSRYNSVAIERQLVEGGNSNYASTVLKAVKKIRFLTLTPQEFNNGPGKSTLLPPKDKLAILANINQAALPETGCTMPAGYSQSREHRHYYNNVANSSLQQSSAISSDSPNTCYRFPKNYSDLKVTDFDLKIGGQSYSTLTMTVDKDIRLKTILVPTVKCNRRPSRQYGYSYEESISVTISDSEGNAVYDEGYEDHLVDANSINELHIYAGLENYVPLRKDEVYTLTVNFNWHDDYVGGKLSNDVTCSGVRFRFNVDPDKSVNQCLILGVNFTLDEQ